MFNHRTEHGIPLAVGTLDELVLVASDLGHSMSYTSCSIVYVKKRGRFEENDKNWGQEAWGSCEHVILYR